MAVPATVAATQASLYVGDLHPDVTDTQLFQAFREFESLSSVRVCRDSMTRTSLRYGYVNFMSQQDAIRAIKVKNNSYLFGKVMRVMWSHRDPNARKSGRGNVFVKNLAESIDNAVLHDLFQKYGNVLSSKVVVYDDGKSKGYGFVQFESEESANSAIENLNGSTVRDKQIYVGKFVRKGDRIVPGNDSKYTNLYIKNLDSDITEALLQEKFSTFGKIISLAIAKDDNGLSKGFAFVNYDRPDDARKAMEAMNGSQFGSKNLYVARAQKKAEREQILHNQFEEKRKEQILKSKGSNLYVKNIDDAVSEKELRNLFSSCGRITSVKVMRSEKGISKGFGFVCFSNPEEANKAVSTFYGCMFHGKPLYIAFAQRKEDRKTQLKLHYAPQQARLNGSSAAVIPGGFSSYFYPNVTSHMLQSGLLYQPLGLGPGWRTNDFTLPTRSFQQSQVPIVPSTNRNHRLNRGRMNGHTNSVGKAHSGVYIPQLQHYYQAMDSREYLTA
ncbi:polyadenylate-binding protein 7-like [Vigna umbellata]|uniref:polyadenylate-binding protein 7-like n=1 Tax=Vigna umbellata TaxID=87088 RepID=UPI001F5F43D4|nr:polyadenylate-binding protein 7-like [Vigna umbellata]